MAPIIEAKPTLDFEEDEEKEAQGGMTLSRAESTRVAAAPKPGKSAARTITFAGLTDETPTPDYSSLTCGFVPIEPPRKRAHLS